MNRAVALGRHERRAVPALGLRVDRIHVRHHEDGSRRRPAGREARDEVGPVLAGVVEHRDRDARHVLEVMLQAMASGREGQAKPVASRFTPPVFEETHAGEPAHLMHDRTRKEFAGHD